MKCPACGIELKDSAYKCSNCGQKIKGNKVAWRISLFIIALMVLIQYSILPYSILPSGQYSTRAKVMEAVTLVSAFKTGIEEYYEANGVYPQSLKEIHPDPTTSGKFVDEVVIDNQGRVISTFKFDLDEDIAGKSIIITPSNGGKLWACSGNLSDEFLPGMCRSK